jgi:hypothetical protein
MLKTVRESVTCSAVTSARRGRISPLLPPTWNSLSLYDLERSSQKIEDREAVLLLQSAVGTRTPRTSVTSYTCHCPPPVLTLFIRSDSVHKCWGSSSKSARFSWRVSEKSCKMLWSIVAFVIKLVKRFWLESTPARAGKKGQTVTQCLIVAPIISN